MNLGFSLSLSGPGLWYSTRAAGVVTLLLFTGSVVLGILNAARFSSDRYPRFLIQGLHRNLSLLAVAFLVVHIGTTVVDTYTSIGLQDAIIPFIGSYKTFWLGLGAIASDFMILVAITSVGRQRLGHRSWRMVHWCAYLSWPIAMMHALGIGTDAHSTWMLVIAFLCAASVVISLGYRGLQAMPARRVEKVAR